MIWNCNRSAKVTSVKVFKLYDTALEGDVKGRI